MTRAQALAARRGRVAKTLAKSMESYVDAFRGERSVVRNGGRTMFLLLEIARLKLEVSALRRKIDRAGK